jgi:ribonuclease BN (tRNA processing enzyme)
MRLVLLGTTGYHPNDRRHTACFLLPECGVMFDAGTGLYRAAKYLATAELDIFLTHAHLDHVIGLSYLLDVTFAHPLSRVVVHGQAEKLSAIEEHLFAPMLFPVPPPCRFEPLEEPVTLAQGGRVSWFPLVHPGGSVGYRLDWSGHSLAYVTDTTASPDAPYLEQIRGVDLLLHECYFTDRQAEWAGKTGHSHTTPVAQAARRAGVGRLLLVHLNPLAAEEDPTELGVARSIFPHTEIGEDLMELEF